MPDSDPLARAVAEARALQAERRPRSALARLAAEPLPDDPGAAGTLLEARVAAAFDAGELREAAADCARLATRRPEDPGWRPQCWEVGLESAPDRAVASAAVAAEIDALVAAAPDDFRHLQAAYRGHLARWDRAARVPLLLRLADLARTPGERRFVAGNLAEEVFGAEAPETRQRLARRLLEVQPDARLADGVVRWVLEEAGPADLAAAHELLGLRSGPPPSWRVALALAEWALEQGDAVPVAAVAALLFHAAAGAAPETLEPAPSGLDPASRDWLWDQVALRLVLARATAWERLGETPRAAEALRAAPATDPPSARLHHRLGLLAEADGRIDEALGQQLLAVENGVLPEAEARLAALLAAHRGYTGPAREWVLARDGGIAFDDVTAAAGLDGVTAQRVAWGDPDGDGDPDLLLDGRLFVNLGDARFVEQTGELPAGPPATGGLWADVDGDGAVDLLLTGRGANRILLNRGPGRWEARELPAAAAPHTEAAAFADVDRDGDLDLYLANHERGGSRRGLCNADQLLENAGDGSFRDVSAAAGIVTEKGLCGRGLTWSDVDGDGWPDAVVGNYRLDPNLLWLNRGGGRFEEAGAAWGVRGTNQGGAFGHTIAASAGDLDGDGRDDLVLTNLAHPRFIEFSDRTQLLLTGAEPPPPPLVDRRAAGGLRFAETESDAALADVDNDGDLDLFVTAIYPERWSRLYLNDGRGRFTDVSWRAGARVANGWGAAFADADNDGALDLLVASADGVRLLRNRGPGGHFLRVRLVDPHCARNGVGARVTLSTRHGKQARTLHAGRGTGSQDEPLLHFGLGTWNGPVGLEVRNGCGAGFVTRSDAVDHVLTLLVPRETQRWTGAVPAGEGVAGVAAGVE